MLRWSHSQNWIASPLSFWSKHAVVEQGSLQKLHSHDVTTRASEPTRRRRLGRKLLAGRTVAVCIYRLHCSSSAAFSPRPGCSGGRAGVRWPSPLAGLQLEGSNSKLGTSPWHQPMKSTGKGEEDLQSTIINAPLSLSAILSGLATMRDDPVRGETAMVCAVGLGT